MKLNDHFRDRAFLGWGYLVVLLAVTAISGCASTPVGPKMEPKSVARNLGLQECRVSVPLSQSDVIGLVKRWDNVSNPEGNPEWIEIVANQRSEDQLRMVSCNVGAPYYYAMIRNNVILLKFHPVLLD